MLATVAAADSAKVQKKRLCFDRSSWGHFAFILPWFLLYGPGKISGTLPCVCMYMNFLLNVMFRKFQEYFSNAGPSDNPPRHGRGHSRSSDAQAGARPRTDRSGATGGGSGSSATNGQPPSRRPPAPRPPVPPRTHPAAAPPSFEESNNMANAVSSAPGTGELLK